MYFALGETTLYRLRITDYAKSLYYLLGNKAYGFNLQILIKSLLLGDKQVGGKQVGGNTV